MIASSAEKDAVWREPSNPQPGARPPAPGDLALVQAFINSHYDLEFEHGADLFATPAALTNWLDRRGLREPTPKQALVTRADVRRAVAAREGLRALARANGEPADFAEPVQPDLPETLAALNAAAAGAAVEVRFSERGPRFLPAAREGGERALGIVLAFAAGAMIDGSWTRLKVCPGDDCGWAFYDHSRNQSGRWCSMAVCGGRAKARGYYRRRRGVR